MPDSSSGNSSPPSASGWTWSAWWDCFQNLHITKRHCGSEMERITFLEYDLLYSTRPWDLITARVATAFGSAAVHEIIALLMPIYPKSPAKITYVDVPCSQPLQGPSPLPPYAYPQGSEWDLGENKLVSEGQNKLLDVFFTGEPKSKTVWPEPKSEELAGIHYWSGSASSPQDAQYAQDQYVQLQKTLLEQQMIQASQIQAGSIDTSKLEFKATFSPGQVVDELSKYPMPDAPESGAEATLKNEIGEDRVELTISGLTAEEARNLMQKYKKTEKLVSTRPLKEIGSGSKGFLFWEFESSSMMMNGTPVKYVTQLNEDGTLSCQCMGWIVGSAKSPQGRHCRHTAAVEEEYDVKDLFAKWKKGLPLGDAFQPLAAPESPAYKKKLLTTDAPMVAKRVIEL